MTRVSAEAAQARVFDRDGESHPLSEFWAVRPVVLVFLRHFG